jgi:hypothetical protein
MPGITHARLRRIAINTIEIRRFEGRRVFDYLTFGGCEES